MIPQKISSKILTIGTYYKNPKGGIASVLNTYSQFYENFNFICTTKGNGNLEKFFVLIFALTKYIFILLSKPMKVVHIHGASYNSFYRKRLFIRIGVLLKREIVYHIHGGEFHLFVNRNARVIRTLKKCNQIVVLSESWRKYLSETFKLHNITIIPNVCNYPTSFQKNETQIVRFLFLGSIRNSKGIFDLLLAIANNPLLFRQVQLDIGGSGENDRLLDYIRKNHLEGKVIFHGWVSGDEKDYLLSQADVYILPSYNEGMPISIIEAMSHNLPIISTPVGGIPEVVEDGLNGFLVEPGNLDQLVSAMAKMTQDPNMRKSMGFNSYDKAKSHFPDVVEKKLINLYQTILNETN